MRLVGRDGELAEVVGRVNEGRRLVTILGPGGIGKTALAGAAVEQLAPRFPMGAHVVELSRIDRRDAVSGALAAQLGFASFDVLIDSPNDLPALVFVDNCEHVATAAADAIGSLVDACQAVTVVATSRTPLALPGESIVVVAPLPVPTVGAVDLDVGAVHLFRERARDNGVKVEDEDLELVADLCRRLDGVPLAIEIAAARLRVLSLPDIVRRLGEGVDVLTRPQYRGAVRHRSVQDTIEWSINLLADADRDAFVRLAVCPGSFNDDVAAAATGLDSVTALDTIERLVDSSLLVVDQQRAANRYRMLEPIRSVALHRIVDPEVEGVRERMTVEMLRWTDSMFAEAMTRWSAELLPRLSDRFDHIDLALRHCVAHDREPARARRVYSALWGMVHQARIDEVLELGRLLSERWPTFQGPYAADAAATLAMGTLLCGHAREARTIVETALAEDEGSGMAPTMLRRVIALVARADGDHRRAAEWLGEAADTAARLGVVTMDLECRCYRAQDIAMLGKIEEALSSVRAAADTARDNKSVLNEIWAHTVEAETLSGVDATEGETVAMRMHAYSASIAYPFGTIANLQTLVACRLQLGRIADAAATADLLLVAIARSGSGDLRRALDAATAVLRAADHPSVPNLATTAAALPDTNPMLPRFPRDHRDADSTRLDRSTAVRLARRSLSDVRTRSTAPAQAGDVEPTAAETFVRAGDVWRVAFRGSVFHVRATKGMEDLAVLLARPGHEIHCLDLVGAGVEESSTDAVIDATARRQYEARVRELQETIDESEANHDLARAERAQAELDQLVDHLTTALGLGGRARRQTGTVERARSAVTHRIRGAIRRIADACPDLGRHLEAAVTTGTYCSYRPDRPVEWRT